MLMVSEMKVNMWKQKLSTHKIDVIRDRKGKNMQFKNRIAILILFIFIGINAPIFAQSPPVSQLTTIQTAEPIGKGGSTTSIGLFQYSKKELTPEESQNVVIGGFEEQHITSLEIETFIIPVRFTYGLSDKLDLQLGTTLSVGNVHKVVDDYYNTGNPDISSDRVYDQPLYDGLVGLKYNMIPPRNDGFPSISIGGHFSSGFTADDRLNSEDEFLDHDPINGFPYVGMNVFFVGSQQVGAFLRFHAGAGVSLSSKSIRTTDSFSFNWQGGGEIALADNMWFAADFSRELLYSGISLSNIIGLAFRYEVSRTLAFQLGFNLRDSRPGFQFNLMLGGEKAQETEENQLLF